MDISFIIVNYSSSDFLFNCVESIKKHAPPVKYEIVIINNDSAPLHDTFNYASLKIINNLKNVGFARACNMGAQAAVSKVLFFLNPDTEITDSNIEIFIKLLNDPLIGIVAPGLITPTGIIQRWSAGNKITPLSTLLNNIGRKKSHEIFNINEPSEVGWVSGGAFAISKKLFLTCQGFDEKFFLYFEDVDLCKRIGSLGKKIMLLPSVQVLHFGGQSSLDLKKQKAFYYQSQDYYFKKHYGSILACLIKFFRVIALFLRQL